MACMVAADYRRNTNELLHLLTKKTTVVQGCKLCYLGMVITHESKLIWIVNTSSLENSKSCMFHLGPVYSKLPQRELISSLHFHHISMAQQVRHSFIANKKHRHGNILWFNSPQSLLEEEWNWEGVGGWTAAVSTALWIMGLQFHTMEQKHFFHLLFFMHWFFLTVSVAIFTPSTLLVLRITFLERFRNYLVKVRNEHDLVRISEVRSWLLLIVNNLWVLLYITSCDFVSCLGDAWTTESALNQQAQQACFSPCVWSHRWAETCWPCVDWARLGQDKIL